MHDLQPPQSGGGLLGDSLDDGRITFDPSARERTDRRDPVCGTSVPAGSEFTKDHKGTQYYFCSEACRNKFASEPERYVG